MLIDVHGANAVIRKQNTLTVGMVGAKAEFTFDDAWDGLTKTAVFRQCDITKDDILFEPTATIPWEVLALEGLPIEIGVYGANEDGSVVIPTVWVETRPIRAGADPSGDESADASLPLWSQMANEINELVDDVRDKIKSGYFKGDTGDSGVYIGEEEPTDPNVKVWIKTNGKADSKSVLTADQVSALDAMFRVCAYTADATAVYAAFKKAFVTTEVGDDEQPIALDTVYFNITNELVNTMNNNSAKTVAENASYYATVAVADGYTLDSITVTMGGEDITADVYANGAIVIPNVTGDIKIVAIATVIATDAELVANGLLAFFDFRSATYNNDGNGGTTTIAATQGNGQLFAWAKNCVEVQDKRGIHFANSRNHAYSQAGNTTATDVGTSFTLVMLTYGHVMAQGFLYANTGAKWSFKPQYKNASGGTAYAEQKNGSLFNADSCDDYNFCVYRVDGNILTEIMDTSVATYDGGDIDGFASWQTTVDAQVQNATVDGHYCTAAAIYNRALTDVEIEEVRAFMKTLEVSA